MLKMLKLLRVMKLKKLLNKFDEYIVTDSMNLVLTFLSLTVQILVVCHYIGCFFFYFGLDEYRLDPEYNGWIVDQSMLEKEFRGQYVTSVYWAFTTMAAVGYGDIHPITMQERTYGMIIIIASSGIFAYTINRISSTVQSYNTSFTKFRERMLYINQFVKEKKMPKELQRKVRRYLDYELDKKKEIKVEDEDVFEMLNADLENQIRTYLRAKTISDIAFIKPFGLDFISELAMYFKNVTYAHDEFLFVEKDKAQIIYFINRGKVAMI